MKIERHIHDRFIKAVFSNIENAKSYFEDQLSPVLLKKIDLDSLRPVSGSFIDQSLKTSLADIVFEAHMKGVDRKMLLSILIEFKSHKDKYVTIQIGHYILSTLWQQVRNGKDPKMVLPVLLYHGRESWDYHTLRSLISGVDKEMLKFVPDFDYIFDNVRETSEHQLFKSKASVWGAVKLLLKNAWDEDFLIKSSGRILMDIRDSEGNIIKESFVYIFSLIKDKMKTMEAIDILPDLMKREARNAYEEILKEGYVKGHDSGYKKGSRETLTKTVVNFFKNGVTVDLISKSLEIPEENVLKILREGGIKS